ncbi:DUF1643 domain-containing protein [Tropicibacter naphthalenivorans]|uniref:DUF1643 domain-containing protein n=1 Tax=Tropicibacter naphthalenivorans TaxID=441103 RepID=A0A0P1GVL8_9RHOB|nr:DUF1643 domain-containing protein [Tropicibacter naphthalenivorans]CUH78099.1 hypothetical protein TRN7648_01791 [Tropicibacter naphthalenivorans]SMC93605.1 hypothetical protein SAMN04488093_10750 [Tropicibacter naphthalenivorans]
MIERHAETDGQRSMALYSPCETYRYGLARRWSDGPEVLYVMLNPSTATEMANDPTIERCQRRAVQLGFGALRIANLFAFRATKPADLRRAADPVGPENATLLNEWSGAADMTIAAWGAHGALLGQAARIAPVLKGDVRHLGLTKAGHPRHPLYVSYDVTPLPWTSQARAQLAI